jgi:putative thioredoxin
METLIGAGRSNGAEGGPPADLIKDGSTARFGQDVIEASMKVPVIVDFWAPWCGPCKQLGPLLEKVVQAARGGVRLVKIDIDQNQALAGQLRIQSIPAVYAFYQGQPVDGFVGAQSESEIKSFVDRLLKQSGGGGAGPSPIEQALEQAQTALTDKQASAAAAMFGQVLQYEPDNEVALAGMIRCHLAAGDTAAAREMFDTLPANVSAKPVFASVAAALELAEQSATAGSLPDLTARVAQNPADHQARFDLAVALHAAGQPEEAADALLEIIRRERTWNEDAARQQLVKFFEAWGPADPNTLAARRRLSSLLFS